MPKSSKERVAAYRDRLKSGTIVPQCKCTRPLKGSLSRKRQLCKVCYDASDDKRHKIWLTTNKRRDRLVFVENLQEWGNYKVGGEVKTPDGSVGVIQAIASYIDSSVSAQVKFGDGNEDSFLISSNNPLIV